MNTKAVAKLLTMHVPLGPVRRMKTGSVQPDDLWDGLSQAVAESGEEPSVDLGTVAKSWTDVPGYPVVSVTVANGAVSFSQVQ